MLDAKTRMPALRPHRPAAQIKFLLRPIPHDDESPCGYLLRLAHSNHYSLGKMQDARFTFLNMSLSVAGKLGCEQIWKIAAGRSSHDGEFSALPHHETLSKLLGANHFRTRICPICLALSGYRRLAWDFPLSVFCSVHATPLVEACHACNMTLSYQNQELYTCECGADLRNYDARPVENWMRDFEKVFSPWRDGNFGKRWPEWIENELALMKLVGQLSSLLNRKAGIHRRLTLPTLLELSALGSGAVAWARGERGMVDQLANALSPIHRTILIAHQSSWLTSYRRESMKAEMATVGAWQRAIPPSMGLVPLATLMDALNIPPKKAAALFAEGRLDHATCALGPATGAEKWYGHWVSQQELQCALDFNSRTLGEDDAAQYLGLTKRSLIALSRAGIIQTVTHRLSGHCRYTPKMLEAFSHALLRRATDGSPVGKRVLTLAVTIELVNQSRKSIRALFERIHDTCIPMFRRPLDSPSLASLYVSSSVLEEIGWIKGRPHDASA